MVLTSRSRAEHEDPRIVTRANSGASHGISATVDVGTARFTRSKTVDWIDRIITDVENETLQAELVEVYALHI